MAKRDYYEILGVKKDASHDEIRKAYRRLAKKWHPDRNKGSKTAEGRFKEISEAYAVLGDQDKRAKYDMMGQAGAFSGSAPGPEFWQSVFGGGGRQAGPTVTFEDIDDHGFGDIFSRMFGGDRAAGAGARPVRGQDIRTQIAIPFDLSIRGGKIALTVATSDQCPTCGGAGGRRQTCPTCHGQGVVQTRRGGIGFAISQPCPHCLGTGSVLVEKCRTCDGSGRTSRDKKLQLRIPRGVRDGQVLRLRGQGRPGANGGPRGDLHVEIHVRPSPQFERRGNDVYSDGSISIVQAALGTSLEVQTVQGPVSLRVPPGTGSGRVLRLKGKGVATDGKGAGDHLVRIRIEAPKDLTEKQADLLRQFGESAGLET